jgi:hypothetical protein
MKNKLHRLNISRNLFKNKETSLIVIKNLYRSNKIFIGNYLFKNKMHTLHVDYKKDNLKSLKGFSLIEKKRKGFYSKFQLTRFDIKKLASMRHLVGLKSFF